MRKVLGIALAMLFTLPIAAAAEESFGRSIILDDATKITVSEKHASDLAPGEQVKAMFETSGSKNVPASPAPVAVGSEFRSTNWGPSYGTEMDNIQAE